MARRSKRSVAIPADARKKAVCADQAPIAKSTPLDGRDIGMGAVVAALAAILYGMSAARDIVVGDTPELVTAAIKPGVAHPPGYPLFTLLGHLFSLLPAGPLPFRLDLLAVVCGAGTVALVYFTALRLSGNRAASACAALVLAFTSLFWSWSLVAEYPPRRFCCASSPTLTFLGPQRGIPSGIGAILCRSKTSWRL
jgi:transmembrane protein TMEM260 (protein O-mannosyltransferase)